MSKSIHGTAAKFPVHPPVVPSRPGVEVKRIIPKLITVLTLALVLSTPSFAHGWHGGGHWGGGGWHGGYGGHGWHGGGHWGHGGGHWRGGRWIPWVAGGAVIGAGAYCWRYNPYIGEREWVCGLGD